MNNMDLIRQETKIFIRNHKRIIIIKYLNKITYNTLLL
jgi:hypothetical protein